MATSQYDLDLSGGLMPVSDFIRLSELGLSILFMLFCSCSKYKLCLPHLCWKTFQKRSEKMVWHYTPIIGGQEGVITGIAVMPAKKGVNSFAVTPALLPSTFNASNNMIHCNV